MDDVQATALSGFMFVFMMVVGLALHLFFGYCFKRIAERAGETETGLWWVPFVNVLLVLRAADRPDWWLVLLLIPIVNIVITFIVWIDVSKALGHGTALGIVAALFGFIGVPVLAFSGGSRSEVA